MSVLTDKASPGGDQNLLPLPPTTRASTNSSPSPDRGFQKVHSAEPILQCNSTPVAGHQFGIDRQGPQQRRYGREVRVAVGVWSYLPHLGLIPFVTCSATVATRNCEKPCVIDGRHPMLHGGELCRPVGPRQRCSMHSAEPAHHRLRASHHAASSSARYPAAADVDGPQK